MEQEFIFSGYCRAIDQSRIVTAEVEDNTLWADCCYPDCSYIQSCQIAEQLNRLKPDFSK